MITTLLLIASGAIAAATAAVLILIPDLIACPLPGADLAGGGTAVARVAGFGLLSVASVLTGLYLGYLRVGGGFDGYLLWPACVLHVLLAVLLARPAYERVRQRV